MSGAVFGHRDLRYQRDTQAAVRVQSCLHDWIVFTTQTTTDQLLTYLHKTQNIIHAGQSILFLNDHQCLFVPTRNEESQ
jgi:hypothetical protein